MVHVIKVYLKSEIRRATVNSHVVTQYVALCEKILQLFPTLAGKTFTLHWKDEEDDSITMSSDQELAQAVACSEEGLIRIYVSITDGSGAPTDAGNHDGAAPHPGVVCDGCQNNLVGNRYKCLQCFNYDLCQSCNARDVHPGHDMLKLTTPIRTGRMWAYPECKDFYSAMFGCDPIGDGPAEMYRGMRRHHGRRRCRWADKGPAFRCGPKAADFNQSGGDKQSQEFLQKIGTSISDFLDLFGVDVKVDLDHGNGVLTPASSTAEKPPVKEQQAENSEAKKDEEQTEVKSENSTQDVKGSTPQKEEETLGAAGGDSARNSKESSPQSGAKTAKELFLEASKWAAAEASKYAADASKYAASATEGNGNGTRPKTGRLSDPALDNKAIEDTLYAWQNTALKAAEGIGKFIQEATGLPDDWAVINPIVADAASPTSKPETVTTTSPDSKPETVSTGNPTMKSETIRSYILKPETISPEPPILKLGSTGAALKGETIRAGPPTRKPETVSSATLTSKPETISAAASKEEAHYPDLTSEKEKMKDQHAQVPQEEAPPLDPKLASALNQMLSMGYTNEGGWLLRLLKTKHGNITAALDSLYQ